MSLSDKQVKKFQKLFLREFGKELSLEEARKKAAKLVYLYKSIYFPEENYQ